MTSVYTFNHTPYHDDDARLNMEALELLLHASMKQPDLDVETLLHCIMQCDTAHAQEWDWAVRVWSFLFGRHLSHYSEYHYRVIQAHYPHATAHIMALHRDATLRNGDDYLTLENTTLRCALALLMDSPDLFRAFTQDMTSSEVDAFTTTSYKNYVEQIFSYIQESGAQTFNPFLVRKVLARIYNATTALVDDKFFEAFVQSYTQANIPFDETLGILLKNMVKPEHQEACMGWIARQKNTNDPILGPFVSAVEQFIETKMLDLVHRLNRGDDIVDDSWSAIFTYLSPEHRFYDQTRVAVGLNLARRYCSDAAFYSNSNIAVCAAMSGEVAFASFFHHVSQQSTIDFYNVFWSQYVPSVQFEWPDFVFRYVPMNTYARAQFNERISSTTHLHTAVRRALMSCEYVDYTGGVHQEIVQILHMFHALIDDLNIHSPRQTLLSVLEDTDRQFYFSYLGLIGATLVAMHFQTSTSDANNSNTTLEKSYMTENVRHCFSLMSKLSPQHMQCAKREYVQMHTCLDPSTFYDTSRSLLKTLFGPCIFQSDILSILDGNISTVVEFLRTQRPLPMISLDADGITL